MSRYNIYEGNIDRLEKKIATIENKCKKYGFDFHYERVGEEFKTLRDYSVDDPNATITARYIVVEVSGLAKHEDWEFVAVVDHSHTDANVIRQYKTDIEVPERYYHTAPICEHCNTDRKRKETYLVHNTKTDEWKQVGKSCLQEFTNGLDAEKVAEYVAFFATLMEFEAPIPGCHIDRYTPVKDLISFAREIVNHFGYVKSVSRFDDTIDTSRYHSTKADTIAYISGKPYIFREEFDRFEKAGVAKYPTDEDIKYAEEAIAWIRNEEVSSDNGYMMNLKTICSDSFITNKDFGIAISLIPTYDKHLGYVAAKKAKEEAQKSERETSQFVGEIKEKLTIDNAKVKLITSWENDYGWTNLYKIVDEKGNVYSWFASKCVNLKDDGMDETARYLVTGTVKDHKEYNGVKQTYLTRCKVTYIKGSSTKDEFVKAEDSDNNFLDMIS